MLRLRQICIAVPQIDAAERLAKIFAVPICFRDPLIRSFGLENALLAFGPTFVEFIAPIANGTAATRFLAKHPGGGGYMVILDTDALTAIRQRVVDAGIRIAHASDPSRPHAPISDPQLAEVVAGYAGFSNLQLHPRDVGGTLLEFNWTGGGENLYGAYAPAGPRWQPFARDAHCPRIAAAELTSPAPALIAERWSSLMDKPVAHAQGTSVIALDTGEVRFVVGASEEFKRVWITTSEPDSVLKRAAEFGCTIEADGFACAGLTFSLRRAT